MSGKRPEWTFDEYSHVGIDYTDRDVVAEFDRQHGTFRDFGAEARRIVEDLNLAPDAVVVDFGCGTGGLATRLARMCGHVIAVDASEAMLDAVRTKAATQKLENVTTRRAGFLDYKHEGPAPDAVISNIALHHLPDFWKQIALCRLHELLKPEGRLFLADVVFGFDPRHYRLAIDNMVETFREVSTPEMAEEVIVHVREEFSTWDWVLSGMLERAGFRIDRAAEVMPSTRAYICAKRGV